MAKIPCIIQQGNGVRGVVPIIRLMLILMLISMETKGKSARLCQCTFFISLSY